MAFWLVICLADLHTSACMHMQAKQSVQVTQSELCIVISYASSALEVYRAGTHAEGGNMSKGRDVCSSFWALLRGRIITSITPSMMVVSCRAWLKEQRSGQHCKLQEMFRASSWDA